MKSVPDQIARFVPKRFVPLGTDGFGRSDTREALRRFFETDAAHVEVAVLSALAAEGVDRRLASCTTPSRPTRSTPTPPTPSPGRSPVRLAMAKRVDPDHR